MRVEVVDIEGKINKNQLCGLGILRHRLEDNQLKQWKIVIRDILAVGESKMTGMEGVKNNMKKSNWHEHIALDRRKQKQRIHVKNHAV